MRSARLLTGGLFNTTYLVDTADQGRTVLRVGPVNRHLLMPFEHRLMEAETQVYALCEQAGIPVSQVLALDTSKSLIDRDYMLVRYIPSKPMNEVTLQSADKARICEDVGRYTARMHAIHAPRFGRITDVAQGGGFARWSECMLDELHSWEGVADSAELYAPDELRALNRCFCARLSIWMRSIRRALCIRICGLAIFSSIRSLPSQRWRLSSMRIARCGAIPRPNIP